MNPTISLRRKYHDRNSDDLPLVGIAGLFLPGFTTSPGLLLGLLLSMAYAGLFHLWVGQSLRNLAAFMVAATIGFAAGHWIGIAVDLPLPQIGQLHVVAATLGAWVCLFVAYMVQQGSE